MIEIRKAEPGDAAAIARVHVVVWRSAYRGLMPDDLLASLSIEQRTDRWHSTIPNKRVGTYVAIVDGELVGFSSVGMNRSEEGETVGELYTIYVLEQSAGAGLGTKLIAAAEQWMVDHGFTDALLWVLASNANARAFYASRGWVDDQFEKVEVVWGAEVAEARYRKRLVGS
ncbi:GNAT family N-acetyltransferase [soil metagenome]